MIPTNNYRSVRKKAIVWFSQKDIDDVKKRDSGIVIVSGGSINDDELYYEGQKCYVVHIEDAFIKSGDCVYVEYDVMTAGKGVQDAAYSQVIEHVFDEEGNSMGYFVWCEKRNILCKFENNILLPVPDLIFIDKDILIDKDMLEKEGWVLETIWKPSQEEWRGKITHIHPDTAAQTKLKTGYIILYEERMDSKEYIEKKWHWMVKADYVLGTLTMSK